MDNLLKQRIFSTTNSEKWHLKYKNQLSPFYETLKTKNYLGQQVFFFDFAKTLKQYNVGMIRETRFTTIPPHLHKDMEMNYIYSGKCTFLINGKKVTLKKGDICILDTGVINSVEYKEKEDIVFNIIFRKKYFSSTFLSQFVGTDTLSKFLLNAIVGRQHSDNFLVFHTKNSVEFNQVFDLILREYYFPEANSIHIIENYCSILFFHLSRLATNNNQDLIVKQTDKNVLLILQAIEKKEGNCSLNDLVRDLHFSSSTIYKLLKSRTGKSFTQIKIEEQLKKAKLLLTETSMPIIDVMLNVGIKNTTFFYDKFKKQFGETPKQLRRKNV